MESPVKPDIGQTRREFCSRACGAATMIAAGTWLTSCAGNSPTSPSTVSASPLSALSTTVAGRTISVALDTASALATIGSAAIAQTSLGVFLIARTGQDTFTVLTATCTHQGCTITGYASQRFVCPCHGSEYTTSGAVVTGPAPTSLRQYASQVANGILSFTV